jgi:hypothetical protein
MTKNFEKLIKRLDERGYKAKVYSPTIETSYESIAGRKAIIKNTEKSYSY